MNNIQQQPAHTLPPSDKTFPHLLNIAKTCGLTKRQTGVLKWMSQGKTNSEIAIIMGNSTRTIQVHVVSILRKLHAENRIAAACMVWTGFPNT